MGAALDRIEPASKARYVAWVATYATFNALAILMIVKSDPNSALVTYGSLLVTLAFIGGQFHLHALGVDLRKTIEAYPSKFDLAPNPEPTWINISPASLVGASAATVALPFPIVIFGAFQDLKAVFLLIPTIVLFLPMLQATNLANPIEVPL